MDCRMYCLSKYLQPCITTDECLVMVAHGRIKVAGNTFSYDGLRKALLSCPGLWHILPSIVVVALPQMNVLSWLHMVGSRLLVIHSPTMDWEKLSYHVQDFDTFYLQLLSLPCHGGTNVCGIVPLKQNLHSNFLHNHNKSFQRTKF